jgi:hypothetical protein
MKESRSTELMSNKSSTPSVSPERDDRLSQLPANTPHPTQVRVMEGWMEGGRSAEGVNITLIHRDIHILAEDILNTHTHTHTEKHKHK